MEVTKEIEAREIKQETAEILFRAWFSMESIIHLFKEIKSVLDGSLSMHREESGEYMRESGRGGGRRRGRRKKEVEEDLDIEVAGFPGGGRFEEREEGAWGLERGFAFSFATSPPVGGLLGAGPDLAGGFPYAATISRMRCAFASAASTICDEVVTSSDSYSVVGGGGGGG